MTYSLLAGRAICKDGRMLATLHGVNHGTAPYDPCEIDTLAREAVAALNARIEEVKRDPTGDECAHFDPVGEFMAWADLSDAEWESIPPAVQEKLIDAYAEGTQ